MQDALPARFWDKVSPEPNSGCWLWTGAVGRHGYGNFHVTPGLFGRAHRVSYEAAKGAIPEGLVLDHKCRVRTCVNPDHLEPVTHRENLLRGEGFTATNAAKTHCVHGHEYTAENTGWNGRWRFCRECARRYQRELRCRRAA